MFLFNKRVLKFFRKDGHQWRRKRDGRAIAEAHERLKVLEIVKFDLRDFLHCCYLLLDLICNIRYVVLKVVNESLIAVFVNRWVMLRP